MKMAQFDRGTAQAAALVVAAGENNRFRSEASFVHFCAIVPIPTSSGRTIRHRHNNTGERDANRALHMILILRLPYCKETKNYLKRRTTEGLTKKKRAVSVNATSYDNFFTLFEQILALSNFVPDIDRNVTDNNTQKELQ